LLIREIWGNIFKEVKLRNKYITTLIKIVISVSLIYYLLYKIGFGKLIEVYYEIEFGWIIFALLLVTVSNLLGVVQWRLLLKSSKVEISYQKTLNYYFIGLFFNNFLISLLGGDIFRVYDISKHSGKNSTAISTVFLDRLIGLMAMAFLALVFGVISVKIFNSGYILFPVSLFFLFLLFVVLFFYFKNFAKKFQSVTEKILPNFIFQKLREIYNGINYFKNHRMLILLLLLNSIVIQMLRISSHYVAALSLNVNELFNISIWYFFIFIPIIFIVSLLPISIGGLGVRESMGIVLFSYVGISSNLAFSIEFISYLIGVFSSIPGGIAFAIRKHEKVEDYVKESEIS
jgi:hypothetical protein